MQIEASTARLRVLLVEDSPAVLAMVAQGLAAAGGFDLALADNLGLGLARLASGDIDAVILDLQLPGGCLPDTSGLEALFAVLPAAGAAPIVVLTVTDDEQLGLEALRQGAEEYLVKGDFPPRLIGRFVRHAVERRRLKAARTHAEEQLREKESHLRMLTSKLPAALWTTDLDLRFTSSHGAGLDGLQLRPNRVVGKTLFEFLRTQDQETPIVAAHRRAINGESVSLNVSWHGRTYHARIEPLSSGSSNTIGAIGIALDVTEHQQIEDEFQTARKIQQRLWPKCAPRLSSLEIAAASRPAVAVGGDFYDFIPMADQSLAVVTGDVAGHGLGSSLLAAATQSYLRALARTNSDPTVILQVANGLLCDMTHDDTYVTLVFAHLNPTTRRLVYVSAGHPPGYILDASGAVRVQLDSTSTVLGNDPDAVFSAAPEQRLEVGEIVFFMTDGLSDAQVPGGQQYGVERALELVRGQRHRSAKEIVDALCQAAQDHCPGGRQHDDITAVIVKAVAAT